MYTCKECDYHHQEEEGESGDCFLNPVWVRRDKDDPACQYLTPPWVREARDKP